jgi:hypothetical protein
MSLVVVVSPKPTTMLHRVAAVTNLSMSGDTQFALFRTERKQGNREAADEHLRLAAMYGHETARKLLLRRRKHNNNNKKMNVAEII